MKVYQLQAEGMTNCNWKKQIQTSTVFTTKEKAEARIEKFKALVSDPVKNMDAILDPVVTIIELEVVE
jgi:hypothetical protein